MFMIYSWKIKYKSVDSSVPIFRIETHLNVSQVVLKIVYALIIDSEGEKKKTYKL